MPSRTAPAVATGSPDELLTQRAEKTKTAWADRDNALDRAADHYWNVGLHKDEGEIYRVRVTDGQAAADLIGDLLSAQKLTISVPARADTNKERQWAEKVEAWLQAWLRITERNEGVEMVHELAIDAVLNGACVVRVLMLPERIKDVEDGDLTLYPLVLEPRDWRNVYPVYSRSRVTEVFECYEISVGDLRRAWPQADIPTTWKEQDMVEMWEWWDEKEKAFWAKGSTMKHVGKGSGYAWLMRPTEHRYGCLPYSIRTVRGQAKRRGDPERLAPSLMQSWAPILDVLNLVESAKMTAAMQYINSAWVVQTNRNDFKLDLSHGAVNYLYPDEAAEPLVKATVPVDLMQVAQEWETRFQRASMPTALYGDNIGPNMAGYAIALLSESGRRILLPVIAAVRLAVVDACYVAIRMAAGLFGQTMRGYGQDLTIRLPQLSMDAREVLKEFDLDPNDLAHVWIDASLTNPLPQDEEREVNLAAALRQPGSNGLPLLSDETLRERFLHVADDERERTRIYSETFETTIKDTILADIAKQQEMEGADEEAMNAGMPPPSSFPPEMLAQMIAQGKQGGGPPMGGPPMPPGAMPEQMPMEGMPPGMPMEGQPPMPPEMMA